MNVTSTPADSAARRRPILAGVATLALLGALFGVAVPVFADHSTTGGLYSEGTGNPTCGDLMGVGWVGTEIVDHPADETAGLQTSDSPATDGTISISYTVDGHLLDFTVDTAGYLVEGVVVKGGTESGYTFYDFRPDGVAAASDLHTVYGPQEQLQGISHISFCVSEATVETSTPTLNGTTTPTEEEGTSTPTGTGGELGGTSGGGRIPDTSTDGLTLGQVVTVLSVLVLVGSVGALALPALARRTNR